MATASTTSHLPPSSTSSSPHPSSTPSTSTSAPALSGTSASAEDVRVITTIGHVDHGKTTFVDYLLAANNIISARLAGKVRYMDSREDEQQRGITMESSSVSLRFRVSAAAAAGGSGSDSQGGKGNGGVQKTYVINLIDTPGHVDFSGEVSSASRLCDGALLLVDVVEGVCTQTITVLRQAYVDRVKPILVLNKCDRLITELKLAPIEAYHHLSQVIEQVNAIMGSFFAGERMEDDLRWREEREKRLKERKEKKAGIDGVGDGDGGEGGVKDGEGEGVDGDAEYQEKDDEDLYFSPDRGNVIFASAVDGWGFRVGKFAQLYAEKLGIKEGNLRRVLWGDYYLDPKTKRVIGYKHLKGRALKPLFVQFVLENVWAVYDGVVVNPNPDKVTKIVKALNLKIPPREFKSKDTRHLLSLIFGQWLSLSTCTIQAVIDVIPPPSVAQAIRMPKMLYQDLSSLAIGGTEDVVKGKNKLERDLFGCAGGEEACVVAYVSKMFAVGEGDLPENRRKHLSAKEMREKGRELREAREGMERMRVGDGEGVVADSKEGEDVQDKNEEGEEAKEKEEEKKDTVLLGFARLYSGVLHIGSPLYCILPKYNAALGPNHPKNAGTVIRMKVEGLYVMMGRDLEAVETVKAGNVFAIRGLEGRVWRRATLCAPGAKVGAGEGRLSEDPEMDRESLINLGGIVRPTPPIVRVALEPVEPANLPKLVEGLKLLSQADPAVETFQQQTGEHVILTAGELHLERCLKDLRERFAKIEIQASEPIVPYRETAIKAPDMAPPKTPNAPRGTVLGGATNGVVRFRIRGVPMPKVVLEFVKDNLLVLRKLLRDRRMKEQFGNGAEDRGTTQQQRQRQQEEEDDLDLVDGVDIHGDVYRKPTVRPEEFWTKFSEVCKTCSGEWHELADRIWAFGPRTVGGCLLVDARKGDVVRRSLRKRLRRAANASTSSSTDTATEPNSNSTTDPGPESTTKEVDHLLQQFEGTIETGFQLATFKGPLCAEPVEGMAYFVESIEVDEKGVGEVESSQAIGSLISAVQEACRAGLLDWSPRLMRAMYSCDIQASTDVLGKVYGVVAKRRGRIVSEEMKEGTSFFTVTALLPVVESFGFADEIRKRTSGAASPQLIFSGYEMLDQDPFWVPTTEEELEDLGEKADRENVAKMYMDRVRERKGMFVDRKIVEFAEKQRTLKR